MDLNSLMNAAATVKITVHTVKCTGTHRNFSSATMNYSNAVLSVCVRANIEFLILILSFEFCFCTSNFDIEFRILSLHFKFGY